ncbi:MAG TPA: ATP-binding protein [Chitinophagaceae bacterium]|jgi:signal transduction histidine kinase/DNA-binding response OmpR family regulator|nr:ATP-binding protein [Chitinophagaceae bacterium]
MKKLLLTGLFAMLYCMQLKSQAIYTLDTNRQVHDLEQYTHVLVDSFNNYNAENIISGQLDGRFQPFRTAGSNKNYSYWLRFSVQAQHPVTDWRLLFNDKNGGSGSVNDNVNVFSGSPGHCTVLQRTGLLVPRSQRSLQMKGVFNRVTFSALRDSTYTFYIQVRNGFSETRSYSQPVIQDRSIPLTVDRSEGMMNILITITVCFCILSLFFYFFVKERSYLYFALYAFLLSQHYLILHNKCPFIDLYIPEHPRFVIPAWSFLTIGGFIIFCIFGRSFIDLPRLSKKTDRWFRTFLIGSAGIVGLRLGWFIFTGHELNLAFIPLLIPVTAFIFIIRFAFFKSILARLFVAGALWLMLFTILGLLDNEGFINLPFNPWPLGQMGQLFIFAAALAYKVRLNEKARAEALRIQEMEAIKSKFFANISHEFRTPLTLIQAPLQQIEEQALNMQKDGTATVPLRQLQTMRRNTDRLLELVNQLLDLSRLDAGNIKLQVVKGDVLQLLRSLAASFDSMAERKQIHYYVHFPEQAGMAFFDKDKLEKIFTNLLSNAFKYTESKGTVSVIVEMEDNRLRLSVEDNGPGIAKKELDKVFDRFYQVEGTEDKGTGIGLALVKELVDLYRGQISVGSEPGKGSRFRVSLPMDKISFKENELIYGEWKPSANFVNRNTDTTEEKTTASAASLLPLLLVVEDHTELRRFICETVGRHYQVIEATNGKEGLEKAISEIPDIIISDVMMPVMDGFVLTEKLKTDEKTSHIPVILLTAKAGQQHKVEGLETGADDYLTKPFDAGELLARIRNLIEQRKLLRKKFAGTIQLKPSEVTVNSMDQVFLANVMRSIEKNMEEDGFGVEDLAREVTMSRSQLHRKLVALIDQSPSDLIRQTRLLRAKELLEKKAATPSEVAFKVGFSSHTYFSKCFKEEFGISPSEASQAE